MLASVGLLATRSGRRWEAAREATSDEFSQGPVHPPPLISYIPTEENSTGSQISTADRTHARTGPDTSDPTHNELKHTTTRKTATHERTL
jgi:hypothetical protein